MTIPKDKIIFFITGASGVGKTTLVNELSKKYNRHALVLLSFRLNRSTFGDGNGKRVWNAFPLARSKNQRVDR